MVKRCDCGAEFLTGSGGKFRCDPCQEIALREQQAAYVARERTPEMQAYRRAYRQARQEAHRRYMKAYNATELCRESKRDYRARKRAEARAAQSASVS